MPAEHNGGEFTFDLSFSENVAAGYARLRDHAFSVNGANIRKAQRKTQGSNQNWTVTVDPTGNGGVSITLPETTNCSNAGAICTDDGRKLNHSTSDSVQGPVGISVSDARVEEAAGAVLAFAVTLSRSASSHITINYATADGSATAGADYTAASGILTIESGSSSGSIEVTVLDDSHNDGEETLTLTLSNASSGVLTDATATGMIENHDAMPRALIARFGRTAAVHIVEQVEERVNAPRRPGFDGRVAGREINGKMGREFALDFLRQLGGQAGYSTPMQGTAGQQTRQPGAGGSGLVGTPLNTPGGGMNPAMGGLHSGGMEQMHGDQAGQYGMGMGFHQDSVLSGSEFALNRATSRRRDPLVLEPQRAVPVPRPRRRDGAQRRRPNDDVRGRLLEGAHGHRRIAVAQPRPRQLRQRRHRPDDIRDDRPLPLDRPTRPATESPCGPSPATGRAACCSTPGLDRPSRPGCRWPW